MAFQIKLIKNEVTYQRSYKIPLKLEEKFEKEIRRYLDFGIIRQSKSNYSRPCFCIQQANGEFWLLTDYRKIKKIVESINEHFPTVFDETYKVCSMSSFSINDLKNGYYKVPI